MNLQLRPYQKSDVAAVLKCWARGTRFPIVECATGLGKTAVIAQLCNVLTSGFPRRVVVIAHRRELITQAKKEIGAFVPRLVDDIGMVMDGHKDYAAKVVVMTVQSATPAAIKKITAHGAIDAVLIDEAHHAHNPTYTKAIKNLGVSFIGGVTATPFMPDGSPLPIEGLEIVGRRNLNWGIQNKYLCPIRPIEIGTEVDITSVRKRGFDFSDREITAVTETDNALELAIIAWEKWGEGRATIAFVSSVAGAKQMVQIARRRGHRAVSVTSETPDDERRKAKEDLQSGAINIAVTVGVWTEGVNIPCVQCLLMCRPTLSKVLYMQMLGRGTRLCEGKPDLLVLDLCPKGSEERKAVSARSLGFMPRRVGRSMGTPKSRAKRARKQKPKGGRLVVRQGNINVPDPVRSLGDFMQAIFRRFTR